MQPLPQLAVSHAQAVMVELIPKLADQNLSKPSMTCIYRQAERMTGSGQWALV